MDFRLLFTITLEPRLWFLWNKKQQKDQIQLLLLGIIYKYLQYRLYKVDHYLNTYVTMGHRALPRFCLFCFVLFVFWLFLFVCLFVFAYFTTIASFFFFFFFFYRCFMLLSPFGIRFFWRKDFKIRWNVNKIIL